jgi:hypothetical protein
MEGLMTEKAVVSVLLDSKKFKLPLMGLSLVNLEV